MTAKSIDRLADELGISDFDIADIARQNCSIPICGTARSCSTSTAPFSISRRRRSKSGSRPDLRQTLARLANLTGGAVALVSGRPLNDIDLIFSPLQLAAIGVHGAEMRARAGAEQAHARRRSSGELKRKLAAVRRTRPWHPGRGQRLFARPALPVRAGKGRRGARRSRRNLRSAPARRVEILPGKLVVEVKPAGINKADAVSELMRHAPFAGRKPIFIGDDTTDVPVFGVIPAIRRPGLFGRRHRAGTSTDISTAGKSVRTWLARIAARRGHRRNRSAAG